ncbi:hypothetical protein E3P91_00061 [Wallemia ichthyophaga]|nr:hypothetical protein E3P91_00061 [Wallemia ichthyophaga]
MEYDQQHQHSSTNDYQLDSLEPNTSLMSAFAPTAASNDSSNVGGPQRRRRSTQSVYHHPYVNTANNIGGNGMPKQRQSRKESTSSQSDNESSVSKAINTVNGDKAQSARQTDNTPFKGYLEAVHDEQDRLCWLRCTFCKVFPERGGANAHSTTPDRIRKHLPACKGAVPDDLRTAAANGTRTNSTADLTLKETTNQTFVPPQSPAPRREDGQKRRKGRYSATSANAASHAASQAASASVSAPPPSSASSASTHSTHNIHNTHNHNTSSTVSPLTPTIENISQSINTSNQTNSNNLANGIALDQLHVLKSRLDSIELRTPKEMSGLKNEIHSIQRDMKTLNGKVEQLLGYMVMNSHFHHTHSQTPRQSPLLSQFPVNAVAGAEVSPTNVQDRIEVVRMSNDDDSPEPNENEQPRQMPNGHQTNGQPQFRDSWFAESNNLVDVQ